MFTWSMTIDYFVRSYVLSLAQYPPPKVPSLAWNVDDVVESLRVWSTTGVCSCGATHMWWHYIAHCGPICEEANWGNALNQDL